MYNNYAIKLAAVQSFGLIRYYDYDCHYYGYFIIITASWICHWDIIPKNVQHRVGTTFFTKAKENP